MRYRLCLAGYLILSLVLFGACSAPLLSVGNTQPAAEVKGEAAPAVESTTLVYLTPDQNDFLQLATMDLSSREVHVLTDEVEGLSDFSLSHDGSKIVYTGWNEDGGADIWSMPITGGQATLLVPCPGAACGRATWSPDGSSFVYERHGGGTEAAVPALWRFDGKTEKTEPLFGNDQFVSATASWSPDGQWFSYYTPGTQTTTVSHTSGERTFEVPNPLGMPVVWDPDGRTIRAFAVTHEGNPILSKLTRYDLEDGSDRGPVDDQHIADLGAAWSPSGDWLAVTRRDWTGAYPSKTQIWLMRGDGSEAHPVLADTEQQYLSPVWSPDGRYLLFQHYASSQSFVQPQVGMLDLETGQIEAVLASGGQVVWAR